ncbi:MAG: enoyl-CoA hydratase-related protein [Dehalococcoidia bacterium]
MPKVLTERRDRTLLVTINRPEVRNCVDGDTAQGLFDAVETFRADDALDVLVLTGAGDASFCSGADLKNLGTLGERPNARETGPMGISRITDVDKPTIAAVNGYCTAGGLELACWCDIRIAARNAQFGVLNRRWGVPLVDGGTQRLPRIVGLGNALYLIETGALIHAEHAQRIGLAQEVVPEGQALQRAIAIAAALSSYPQLAIRNDRKAALDGLTLPIDEALELEVRTHRDTTGDPKMAEWLQRYASGDRPAPFRPPEHSA